MGALTQSSNKEGIGNCPLLYYFIVQLNLRKMTKETKTDMIDFILIIGLLALVCTPFILHYL